MGWDASLIFMDISKKKITIIILVLLISEVGLIYSWLNFKNINFLNSTRNIITLEKKEPLNLITHRSYHLNQKFYDEAYDYSSLKNTNSTDEVYGGIIPHHLMPKNEIANWFIGLEDKNYKTVVLIGPNHFEVGNGDIIISQAKWDTPYGELMPNLILGDKLLENDKIILEEQPFDNEHSISGLVPFIKKSFPKATIVPIILKYNTDEQDLEYLANILATTIDLENTLVLASVDFSHFQTTLVSDFHDELSQNVIETFDFNRIHNLEIDSPASIYTLLKYLEQIKAQKTKLLTHTDSSVLINKPDEPGTTHFYYYFLKGEPKTNKIISLMFFGDMMLDRHVKTKIEKAGIEPIFKSLATEESRFFMGSDIVSANLEGALTNNGEHYPPEASIDFAIDPKLISQINQDYYFNFFTIANNHITDQGNRGVEETTKNLNDLGIKFAGCPDTIFDDCSTNIITIADQRIAMVALSMVYNNFNLEEVKQKISKLTPETDLVVVQIHWGVEYSHNFNQQQQDIAHTLIDAGTDIIIGHHPHVVQGVEIYKNKPIFYSLGNFIFDQYFSQDTQEGLSVSIVYENNKYTIYLFTIKSTNSELKQMTSLDKLDFLKRIASWSIIDQEYKDQLLNGKIILN